MANFQKKPRENAFNSFSDSAPNPNEIAKSFEDKGSIVKSLNFNQVNYQQKNSSNEQLEEKRVIVSVSISTRQKQRAQWLKKHRGIIFSAIAGNAIDEIYEKEINRKG